MIKTLFTISVLSLLVACSSPHLTSLGLNRIVASHDINYEPFEPALTRVSDGFAMLRRINGSELAVEHYRSDSLTLDWSIPFASKKNEQWSPIINYRDGVLYAAGPVSIADGDSIGLRFTSIDIATRSKRGELIRNVLPTGQAMVSDWKFDKGKPARTNYEWSSSPDSNLVLFYSIDYATARQMIHKSPTVHALLFDIDGTLRRLLDIPIAVEDTMIFAEIALTANSMAVDNDGNIYLVEFHQPATLEVLKYTGKNDSPSDRLTTTVDNVSLASGYKLGKPLITFSQGLMLLTAARLNWGHFESVGYGYEEANDLAPIYGTPSGTTQVNVDFTMHRAYAFEAGTAGMPIASLYDSSRHRTIVADESRVNYTSSSSQRYFGRNVFFGGKWQTSWMPIYHSENYCHGMSIGCYDDSGKQQWLTYLYTTHSPAQPYYAGGIRNGQFEVLYDREDTVRSLTLDVATGNRSSEKHLFMHPESTILFLNESVWLDPKNLIVFAKGPTIFQVME